jgi:hypothetical protein
VRYDIVLLLSAASVVQQLARWADDLRNSPNPEQQAVERLNVPVLLPLTAIEEVRSGS